MARDGYLAALLGMEILPVAALLVLQDPAIFR